MSIFSHSITQVATQVQRVIEDKLVPNSIRDGSIRNQFNPETNGEQLIESIMDQISNGMGLRANRMYEYGKNGYIFGLPSSTLHSSLSGQDASKAAIEVETGVPIAISYYHFGRMNLIHLAWFKLITDYGYNSVTNELLVLSQQKGYPVYLRDMQAVVIDATTNEIQAGTLDTWGPAASSGPRPENLMLGSTLGAATKFIIDPAAANDYVRVDISWESVAPVTVQGVVINKKTIQQESFNLPMTGYNVDADYHQARYIVEGKAGYWVYQPGTGTHPEVDAVFDAAFTDDGSFFPIGYIRFNGSNDSLFESSEKYKSLDKLFGKLNMDFETIAKSIHSNPDADKIEQAVLMMAVPAVTQNEIEIRYLFDFFGSILPNVPTIPVTQNPTNMLQTLQVLKQGKEQNTIIIQDKRFKMAVSFDAISKTRVAGSVGKVGTYAIHMDTEYGSINVPVVGGTSKVVATGLNQHCYRHQITEDVYEEVRVYGLKTTYFIWAEYTTAGEGIDAWLIIPVDIKITKHYSVLDREELYARGLHYVFNTRVTTDLEWYQTGLFRVVLIIIAIVCTILSNGTTWELFADALAAGTLTVEAFIMVLVDMAIDYIINALLVQLFVQIVGAKVAFVAAVVAALFGMYQSIGTVAVEGAPLAQDLLSLASNLGKAAGKQVHSDVEDLLGEQNEFEAFMEKQTKLLDTAEELLNNTGRVNPLLIFGETPNEFYQRTVHSGNIGTIGIDAISSYVDISLRLPKLSETLGDYQV